MKPDYLTRIAAQAVQAPAIMPRIAARFEHSARAIGEKASLREIEEWVEAPRQPELPETTPGQVRPEPARAAEATSTRVIARVDDTQVPSSQQPADIAPLAHPSITVDVRRVPSLDAGAVATPIDVTPNAARTEVRTAESAPVPTAPEAVHPSGEAEETPLEIGHLLRLDVAPFVQAPLPAATPMQGETPGRSRASIQALARVDERAAPAAPPPLRVEVNIDRIEVRALTPTTPVPTPPLAPTRTPMSLDEHLRRRRGEPA